MSKEDTRHNPIGGYFELEKVQKASVFHNKTLKYQSARAAFRAIVRAIGPTKVWVPKHICNSMLDALEEESMVYELYDLTVNYDIKGDFTLGESELILYVNYLGVCDQNIDSVLSRFPCEQVILDCAQAYFFIPKRNVLATIYSPRKYFGVPDGGLLVTDVSVNLPITVDIDSDSRLTHLLMRLQGNVGAGYEAFKHAEQSLIDSEPKKMSEVTVGMLNTVGYVEAKKKRDKNFQNLCEQLNTTNSFNVNSDVYQSPLCYPYLTNKINLRQYLIDERVYIPKYWDDSIARVGEDWADEMIEMLLPLPIDHRYDDDDMNRIVQLILNFKD